MFFKIVWNEIKKEILTAWSYRLQWLGEFISLLVFFTFLIALAREKQIAGVSYCLWFYSILIIGDISGKISTDMRSGTFEQIYLSAIPVPFLLFAKVISAIFRSFIIMCSLFIIISILGYITLSSLPIIKLTYTMLIITPGLFGLSLFLGGLTILLKDVGWIINIINNSLLFLSGIFMTIESFPKWLQYVSQISIITNAVDFIKINHSNNALSLFILSTSYLVFGSVIFLYCEKKAKLRGCLGHY
ncbi:MAG: ABC transporter permease [Parachlamydiaceae bacterium]